MAAVLEIYDTSLTSPISSVTNIGDRESGTQDSIVSVKVQNDGDATATNVRLFARCSNGLYDSQNNSVGQEAVTEQWVEADTGSGYTVIGGDFSPTDPATNYIALSDITAGSSTATITFRLNIPASVSTAGEFYMEFGVSYEP